MPKNSGKGNTLVMVGFMLGAVLFAGIAGMLVSSLARQRYGNEPVTTLIVAQRDLPAGRLLSADDLKIASWPVSAMPTGAFRSAKALVDPARVTVSSVVAGQPIVAAHVALKSSGLGVAPLIPANRRAMTFRTDDPVVRSPLLYPGATIDLIVTFRRTNERTMPTISKIVLQNLTVLAVGEDTDAVATAQKRSPVKSKVTGATATPKTSSDMQGVISVLVTPQEAEQLALAVREGTINLALRNPSDTRAAKTPGATPMQMLVGADAEAAVEVLARKQAAETEAADRVSRDENARSAAASRRTSTRRTTRRTRESSTTDQDGPGVMIYRGGSGE